MAKNVLKGLLITMFLLLLASCGEDRSGEYHALIEDNEWIYSTMKQNYLWYDQMPTPSEDDFFAEPEDFFYDLLISTDKFSYFEADDTATTRSIDYASTYGFDFALYQDPLVNSGKYYARVTLVLPDSPAEEAGLLRGDWISSVGEVSLTSSNYGYLLQGGATTLQTVTIVPDSTDDSYVWADDTLLQLSASREASIYPFYVDTIYTIQGMKIAYLVYNRFTAGPLFESDETEYLTEMISIFAKYNSAAVDAFILDLRFNPGGYLFCAQQLASLIVPSSAFGSTFCSLVFNDLNSSSNYSLSYEESLTGGANLGLEKLYVITSNYTASASEALIYCLQTTMGTENVVTIGTTTVGKNVASIGFQSSYAFTIYPIVATVYNSEGESDYSSGITPTYDENDLSYIGKLYPLGSLDEFYLSRTVELILSGEYPGLSESQERRGEKSVFNSLSLKDNSLLAK